MQTHPPNFEAKVEDLFGRAVELTLSQREAFVCSECGDDEQLAASVKRLLEFHDKNLTSEFVLDKPWIELDANAVSEFAESEGDIIGRYKLLERIGEGGMGVVYMAEQLEGVRRRVALKIIKLGMDTRQVIARFEAEQQAMALFDHPNITRVFDAGATSTGRPYFVMELVRGTNVSEYVTGKSLSLEQRLKLFVDICKAVHHAHQKGIIHRDLKPSNILVTLFDGVPVPKVIDFGIAKAIGQQRLTEKTLFTRYSAMVGTPQYMSPEQAEMTGIDVDTRSDIYSLGVLLYEMVTGTTPISSAELKQLNPVALYETLRDAEVETPSTRIAKTENGETKPELIPATSRQIGGELDWVIMKALARDRSQRYASANEFAADVQRFLEGDSVLAAPPSKIYQLKSYVRKHRAAALTVGIVATALITATIMCSIFALNARNANLELSRVNEKLTDNVTRLQTAEAQVRAAADEKLYDSAHSIAIERFNSRFMDVVYQRFEEVFESRIKEVEEAERMLREGIEDEPFEAADFMYGICFDYDQELLLKIGLDRQLAKPLERIRNSITRRKDVLDRVWEGTEEDFPEGFQFVDGDHEHTEECMKLRKEVELVMHKHRPAFYRLLVDEYRKSFGEQDSRVADGLQLLAASLIDLKEFDEAEAHLRESALMGEASQKSRSRQMLDHIAIARR